jgi:hypothetical protein
MDEKTHNDSVTSVVAESSEDIDSAPVEKIIEQNDQLQENLADEAESKTLVTEPTLVNALDNPQPTGPHAEVTPAVWQEQEEPDKMPEYETAQYASSDGDDAEELEKEADNDNEDFAYKTGGSNTEDEVTENLAQSEYKETDEGETVTGSPEEKKEIEERDEKQEHTEDAEDDDPPVQTKIEPETTGAEEETDNVVMENAFESSARKPSVLKVAVSAVLIATAFCGFFLFDNKSKVKANSQKALNTSENREITPDRHKQTKVRKPITSKTSSIYSAKIEEVTSLRDSLLLKQKEVMRLKKQYQDGIQELEKEISDELQKGKITTFLQAMEDSAIVFMLKTVQRRQAYVQQLETPSKWIQQGCEELLYLKRRTMMDIEVAEIAGGIDLNENAHLINAAVRKYQPTADKLALDMKNAQLEPLESIWKRIQNKAHQSASVQAHSKNEIISEQICMGNFSRLNELSEISTQTASCIAEMRGSDLFLNSLSEIPPAAARRLFQWKGTWICLNGVRALSPRTAHYLFQWNGNWISLNGLNEFPAEIGEKLLQWEGQQLELMGLQYLEDFPSGIALEYLSRWEHAGGKLFVPEAVRKKLDEINAEST